MRKPTNAGLTDQQARQVLAILRKAGMIAERKLLCELIGITPKKLQQFLQTRQAIEAADEATDLSRMQFLQELKDRTCPEELIETGETIAPTKATDALAEGLSIRDDRFTRRYSEMQDEKSRALRYAKDQGIDLTPEEYDRWDKLAEGE